MSAYHTVSVLLLLNDEDSTITIPTHRYVQYVYRYTAAVNSADVRVHDLLRFTEGFSVENHGFTIQKLCFVHGCTFVMVDSMEPSMYVACMRVCVYVVDFSVIIFLVCIY